MISTSLTWKKLHRKCSNLVKKSSHRKQENIKIKQKMWMSSSWMFLSFFFVSLLFFLMSPIKHNKLNVNSCSEVETSLVATQKVSLQKMKWNKIAIYRNKVRCLFLFCVGAEIYFRCIVLIFREIEKLAEPGSCTWFNVAYFWRSLLSFSLIFT